MKAYPSAGAAPQPDGASKLCLSCHDGTIALGAVGGRTTPIAVSGGPTMPTTAPGYLGTDLSGSHPISFVYDNALAVAHNAGRRHAFDPAFHPNGPGRQAGRAEEDAMHLLP